MADYSVLGLYHEATSTADTLDRLRELGVADLVVPTGWLDGDELAAAYAARELFGTRVQDFLAIDPLDHQRCLALARTRGWEITQVLNTHEHGDHIGGNQKVIAKTGARLLEPLALPRAISVSVRHHHERWDGGGYPDGLAGEEIPLISRVIAVADTFDAMSSHRPYRDDRRHQQ